MRSNEYLVHYGIKGQKWGYRRWQNPDGTLTEEGKIHYHKQINREARKAKIGMAAFGAYGGGIAGTIASTVSTAASFAGYATPIAALSAPAIVAGGAAVGALAAAAITYKDINFARDEKHMYVDSGKYFMERNIKVK